MERHPRYVGAHDPDKLDIGEGSRDRLGTTLCEFNLGLSKRSLQHLFYTTNTC